MSSKSLALTAIAVQIGLGILLLALILVIANQGSEEPTTWREPPWFPPDTMNVTVERDCSMEHGLYKKMCETGQLPD